MSEKSKPETASEGRSAAAATLVSGVQKVRQIMPNKFVPKFVANLMALAIVVAATLLSSGQNHLQAQALSDEVRISLYTMMPGNQIHSMFGHSAFGIYDPVNKIDRIYNYGTFDFGEPGFVWKFVRRELDYKLSIITRERMLQEYRYEDRPVIEQELNLPTWARESLFVFLETNYLPENRYYRYDFLFDNCSTRLRDALQSVLEDDLEFKAGLAADSSYRQLLDGYVIDRPGIDWGFDIGLGLPTDDIAGTHGAQFLPDYLMMAFDEATVNVNGVKQPLVRSKQRLFEYRKPRNLANELGFLLWPAWMVVGLTLLWSLISIRQLRKETYTWRRAPIDGLIFGITGLLGVLVFFLWFFTEHAVTKTNLNLLWAMPSHLLLAVWLLRKNAAPLLLTYLRATCAVLVLTLLALPFLPQVFHPVSVACMLILLIRAATLWYRSAAAGSSVPAPKA